MQRIRVQEAALRAERIGEHDDMLKIIHLITDLFTGGAEMMLYKLVTRLDRTRFENVVISMIEDGELVKPIEKAGVPVLNLEMKRGVPDPRALLRLSRILREEKPQVLQTWLYHSDLVGLAAARLGGVQTVVWNIRCSNVDMQKYSRLSAITRSLLAALSSRPSVIVANSYVGRDEHVRFGYRPRRWEIIPNGFDVDAFAPDHGQRSRIRGQLGIADRDFVIGTVGRLDPMKDYATFFRAATILLAKNPNVHFLLAGRGLERGKTGLAEEASAASLQPGNFHLIGERSDIPPIMNAMDIFTLSSSFGEGFPNAIGEAMSCGVPCVATNVGDVPKVVNGTGILVPPGDAVALAAGWEKMITMSSTDRYAMGRAARIRIVSLYSLPAVVARYESLYEELAAANQNSSLPAVR